MNAADHRAQFYADHLRTLNRLVFAAEALDTPPTPERPDWKGSPENAETIETLDPEELRALAVKWQAWASKLDDVLAELGVDEGVYSDLRAKAKEARLALIALEVYEPPSVVGG